MRRERALPNTVELSSITFPTNGGRRKDEISHENTRMQQPQIICPSSVRKKGAQSLTWTVISPCDRPLSCIDGNSSMAAQNLGGHTSGIERSPSRCLNSISRPQRGPGGQSVIHARNPHPAPPSEPARHIERVRPRTGSIGIPESMPQTQSRPIPRSARPNPPGRSRQRPIQRRPR